MGKLQDQQGIKKQFPHCTALLLFQTVYILFYICFIVLYYIFILFLLVLFNIDTHNVLGQISQLYLKEVSYAHQDCMFDQNTVKTVIL